MARKSRKNLPQPEQAMVSVQFPELDEEKIPTAIYGRLSVEDDEDNESMETQIALVQDFINRSSELNYVDTYFDNGFTGTNFKRPAFTRLMNDVRQKKIKCIVVKDLSRFGRNYLEAGYYIETVFPFLGVRLIAVTDHFDSTRKEDMKAWLSRFGIWSTPCMRKTFPKRCGLPCSVKKKPAMQSEVMLRLDIFGIQ